MIKPLLLSLLIATLGATTPLTGHIQPHLRGASPDLEPRSLGRYVCPPNFPRGTLACTTETSYVICSNLKEGSEVMPVAAGTVCRDNKIVAAPAAIKAEIVPVKSAVPFQPAVPASAAPPGPSVPGLFEPFAAVASKAKKNREKSPKGKDEFRSEGVVLE